MNSISEENYLKALFHLSKDKQQVHISTLGKYLNIKMPTVNSMMKKLQRKHLIIYKLYKPVMLTELGRQKAIAVLRKHRLIETFLVEKMQIDKELIHSIAEQLEHVNVPLFFDRIDEMLNFPTVDPHGDPIPPREEKIEFIQYVSLDTCNIGEVVTLGAFKNMEEKDYNHIKENQLFLGTSMRVEDIFPHSNEMSIRIFPDSIRREVRIISKNFAERLMVKKLNLCMLFNMGFVRDSYVE